MPILALHGFTGRGTDFEPLAQLVGGEWRCPDLPGHGPNMPLDCSGQTTVQFIACKRKANNILLGYSMGARAALLHATKHPEAWKALILISPNPGIEDESERAARREADEALAQSIELEGVASFLEHWQETPLIRAQKNLPNEVRIDMQKSRLEHRAEGLANSLRQFGQGQLENLWPQMHKLKMPVCIITGEQDAKYSQIARHIQEELGERCQHFNIPGVSHAPHIEAYTATAPALIQFLGGV